MRSAAIILFFLGSWFVRSFLFVTILIQLGGAECVILYTFVYLFTIFYLFVLFFTILSMYKMTLQRLYSSVACRSLVACLSLCLSLLKFAMSITHYFKGLQDFFALLITLLVFPLQRLEVGCELVLGWFSVGSRLVLINFAMLK